MRMQMQGWVDRELVIVEKCGRKGREKEQGRWRKKKKKDGRRIEEERASRDSNQLIVGDIAPLVLPNHHVTHTI